MTDKAALLATLIDVQEPPAPEQALPWILFAILLLLVAIPLIVAVRIQRYRSRWRREALQELSNIQSSHPDPLAALATLLRRIAHHRLGDHVIHLDDKPWLKTLDRCFNTTWFTEAEGKVFGAYLYQHHSTSEVSTDTLCRHIRVLVKRLPNKARQSLQ